MENEHWLKRKEAADLANVSEKTIDRAIRHGQLRKAKNGLRCVRIAYSDLVRWMNGPKVFGAR